LFDASILRKALRKYQAQKSDSSVSSSSKNGSIARQTRQRSGDHRHGRVNDPMPAIGRDRTCINPHDQPAALSLSAMIAQYFRLDISDAI
jgi:hypothetical protein